MSWPWKIGLWTCMSTLYIPILLGLLQGGLYICGFRPPSLHRIKQFHDTPPLSVTRGLAIPSPAPSFQNTGLSFLKHRPRKSYSLIPASYPPVHNVQLITVFNQFQGRTLDWELIDIQGFQGWLTLTLILYLNCYPFLHGIFFSKIIKFIDNNFSEDYEKSV